MGDFTVDNPDRISNTARSEFLILFQEPDSRETLLANSPQARKRARQAEVRRQRNMAQRSTLRTFIKKVIKAIRSEDKDAAIQAFKEAVPRIDRAARKGLIHANKAARHKSRLNAHIKAMA